MSTGHINSSSSTVHINSSLSIVHFSYYNVFQFSLNKQQNRMLATFEYEVVIRM